MYKVPETTNREYRRFRVILYMVFFGVCLPQGILMYFYIPATHSREGYLFNLLAQVPILFAPGIPLSIFITQKITRIVAPKGTSGYGCGMHGLWYLLLFPFTFVTGGIGIGVIVPFHLSTTLEWFFIAESAWIISGAIGISLALNKGKQDFERKALEMEPPANSPPPEEL